jgi:hypothetical protein
MLDSISLAFLVGALVWPIFHLEYLNNWPSIESTFIADARMLADRLPHPGWQPLWYCGTRFDYIYPPALRYGTVLLSTLGHISTARAYHLYTGIAYVLGILLTYAFVRTGSGSRGTALLVSVGTALLSPSFLLLPLIRSDSPYSIPQRLHVLMTYGEGPHISALSILPGALLLTFVALRTRKPAAFAVAAILCAFCVANNFYGATALVIFFPTLVWSVWVGEPVRSVWIGAAAIAALAYALSAFWLTPSYAGITAANLSLVAPPGNHWSLAVAVAVAAMFCIVTWRWGNHKPQHTWTIFVAGAAVFFSLSVLGYYYFGFLAAGNPPRLVPELDLALTFLLAGLIHALWAQPRLRVLAVLIVLAAYPAANYLRHAYSPFERASHVDSQYEFKISKWVHDHLTGERVLTSGTVRLWFDAWFDNAETGGGSDQGMLNRVLPGALFQATNGEDGHNTVLWMQALGTDAVIVPGAASPEFYHDYRAPEKFRGLVPVLFDDGQGTVIYRIPRRYPGIGRVVETVKIAAARPINPANDVPALERYVAVVESADQDPAPVLWRSVDEFDLEAHVSHGQSILVQETYDSAWHAYEHGHALPIRIEPVMNFMLIDVAEGSHQIQVRFETPMENRIGQSLCFAALAVIAALLWRQLTA